LELADDKVYLLHKVLGKVGYFEVGELIDLIKHKLGDNLLLVLANVKKEDGIEYFHYTEAHYFSNFYEEIFKQLIKDGQIVFEFRLHLYPSGSARDRGSGFRISRKYLPNLYEERLIIISGGQK